MPANVLFVAGECCAHQVNRVHSDAGNMAVQVGDLFSLKLVCSVANNTNRMYRVLEKWVHEDLDILDRSEVAPAEYQQWQKHRYVVLEHTK